MREGVPPCLMVVAGTCVGRGRGRLGLGEDATGRNGKAVWQWPLKVAIQENKSDVDSVSFCAYLLSVSSGREGASVMPR